jgi:hypothetical protein
MHGSGTSSLLRLFTQHASLHAQRRTSAVNKRSRVAGWEAMLSQAVASDAAPASDKIVSGGCCKD